jgi:hypothetical protein
MQAGKSVLVISFSHLAKDPRVSRQIALLANRYRVTAAGYAGPCVSEVEFVPIAGPFWSREQKIAAAALLKLRLFDRAYGISQSVKTAHQALGNRRFDLILANDANTLPLALALKGDARLLFDAHEYFPLEFEENWKWRFFLKRYNERIARRYLPLVDGMTTVCEGIVDAFAREFGIRPVEINNAPHFADLAPVLRPGDETIRLVSHGAAIPSRQIESMIDAMRHLDQRFSLDLILVPSVPGYVDALRARAAGDSRIRILPPVDMGQVAATLNSYDVGIYLLAPNNFNNYHSLPNKFFEFVQARLAIAVGPSPEMSAYLNRHGMGVASTEFTPRAFAQTLAALDRARVDNFKTRAHAAARELCFEKNAETLLALVERILER